MQGMGNTLQHAQHSVQKIDGWPCLTPLHLCPRSALTTLKNFLRVPSFVSSLAGAPSSNQFVVQKICLYRSAPAGQVCVQKNWRVINQPAVLQYPAYYKKNSRKICRNVPVWREQFFFSRKLGYRTTVRASFGFYGFKKGHTKLKHIVATDRNQVATTPNYSSPLNYCSSKSWFSPQKKIFPHTRCRNIRYRERM